jgi:hypothetical protein
MKDFNPEPFCEYPKTQIILNGFINKKNVDQPDLSQVIITKNINVLRYLVLPFHRFCSNYKIILLSNDEITKKEIYDIIYDFYNNSKLSLIELKSLNEYDAYNFITNVTINKKENPHMDVNPIDIMGDKIVIEYISVYEDRAGDIQYTLHLRS